MRIHIKLFALTILAALAFTVGCVTKNPDASDTAHKWVADTNAVHAFFDALNSAVDQSAPINPWAGVMKLGFGIGAAIVTGGSLAYANMKNKTATQATGALDTMSLAVVSAGPEVVRKVSEVAAATPHYATVANAINENTP